MKKIAPLLASLVITFAAGLWASQSVPAELTINDAFTGTLLNSDGRGIYYDHSLSNNDPCVTAWVSRQGLFFIYFDYNSAYGFPGACDSTLGIDGTPEDRTYSVTFPSSSGVCAALGISVNSLNECVLAADDRPRIRGDNLFAPGASSTPVAIMFYWNGNSYSLQPDNGASVSGTGNTRTATSGGNATLWQSFSAPQKPKQIGSSFLCPFQFTVTIP